MAARTTTTTTDDETTETIKLSADLLAEPAPGPALRVQRTAGQVGGVLIILELWLAFGWFGADDWTERQVLAVTAAAIFLASAVQNVVGHLHSRSVTIDLTADDT